MERWFQLVYPIPQVVETHLLAKKAFFSWYYFSVPRENQPRRLSWGTMKQTLYWKRLGWILNHPLSSTTPA
ncbi:hypothetical protein E6H34_02865 [Candidatus Bathyarchaeota archaeon]|nr:MAG: hypothetical protein E6H34_02865 [Candidatus Bathyarchaeota archaeon]